MLSCPYAQEAFPPPQQPPISGPPPLPFPPPVMPPGPGNDAAPVIQVSPGVFRLGEIELNKKTKTISFPANVCMDKGLLEYVLVRATGKTYESLLRTNIEPYNLQLAFLLLGFEPTDRPLRGQGDPEKPKGELLEITISYNTGEGKTVVIKPEAWMIKKTKDKSVDIKKLDWVYTGSLVMDGRFLAQQTGSIIAVYHDPAALIDHASEGGESDEVWFVKEGHVLPVGTAVKVTIKGKK